MSDKNNTLDMRIDIETRKAKQGVEELTKEIDSLTKGIKRSKSNQDFAKLFENAKQPALEALDLLKEHQKRLQKFKKEAQVLKSIGDIEGASKNSAKARTAQRNLSELAQTIKRSAVVQKNAKEITKQYNTETREISKTLLQQFKAEQKARFEKTRQNELNDRFVAQEKLKAKLREDELSKLQEVRNETIKTLEEIDKGRMGTAVPASESAKVFASAIHEQEVAYETENKMIAEQRQQRLEAFELSLDKAGVKLNKSKENLIKWEVAYKQALADGDNFKLKQAAEHIKHYSKQIDKLNSYQKKTNGWQKLLYRIRNISIYRMIRTGIHWLVSGIQDGVNVLVRLDDRYNQTMSDVTNSLTQARNTLSVSFLSIMEALSPMMVQISDGFVDLVNNFNLAMAQITGRDTYYKAIKSMEEYADTVGDTQGKLADFDKFRSLDTQTEPEYSIASVAEDANNFSKVLQGVIYQVKTLLETAFEFSKVVANVLKSLIESGALKTIVGVVSTLVTGLANIVNQLQKTGALKGILYTIVGVFVAWKVAAIGAAIASAAAFAAAHPYISGVVIAGVASVVAAMAAMGFGSGGVSSLSSNISSGKGYNVQGFANGGFTTANFIATNENGKREWVGRNAGATAVVNDSQMSEIMYQAVKDGCYNGVISALSDAEAYGGGTSSTTAQVQVSGETIFTIVKDVAGRKGLKFAKV